MQRTLTQQERERVQARVRVSTTAHLLGAAARHGLLNGWTSGGPAGSDSGRFTLRLGGGAVGWMTLAVAGGEVRVADGARGGIPSLTLRFPRPRDAVAVLTGRPGGRVIPIPGGLRAGRALAFFKSAGPRVAAAVAGRPLPGEERPVEAGIRAALLIEAAVRGIVEVANHDRTVERRRAHMGHGLIELVVEGEPRAAMTIDARQPRLAAWPGTRAGERPSARLSFESAEVAVDVLTGRRSAVVALGSGAVKIRGRLSLIQNLFPLLERLETHLAAQ